MRDTIAVGVDDSTAGSTAVRWAMRRAAVTGSDVVLIHVLDDEGWPLAGSAQRSAASRQLLARQRRIAAVMAPRARIEVRTLRGSPMWQLVDASVDVDLVVVGTRRTGFIHESVYGSAGLPLASASACPVVVVPAAATADPTGVVVGADDSGAGRAALHFAAAEAARTQQPLIIVRVSPDDGGAADFGSYSYWERAADVLLTTFADAALRQHPELEVSRRHLLGSAGPLLVTVSSRATMLVLGDSQTSGIEARALGAVGHDALLNIRVPTAIVHGDGRCTPSPISDLAELAGRAASAARW